MSDNQILAPKFDFGAAITQIFNLPGGSGYLFRVLGWATLILTAAFALLGFPIVKAYVSLFQGIASLDAAASMTEAEEMALVFSTMQPIFAAMGWFFLLYLVQIGTYVSVETALYRNIIRGEDKGLFPLRFGMDEFKVLVTRIVVAIILYAAFFVVYFVLIIVGAMIYGLGSAADSTAIIGIASLVVFILIVAMAAAMIYLAIRLAPSAAFSVRDEDFTPVGSWATMKTYFWPSFGAVLVVGLIGYIVLAILSLLAFSVLFMSSGLFSTIISLGTQDVPDFTPILDILTSPGFIGPAVIISLILTFLSLLYMGAIWSIWAYVAKLSDRRGVVDQYA